MEIKSFICNHCDIEFPKFELETDINGDMDSCRLCVWEWILQDYNKDTEKERIICAQKEIIKIPHSRNLYK